MILCKLVVNWGSKTYNSKLALVLYLSRCFQNILNAPTKYFEVIITTWAKFWKSLVIFSGLIHDWAKLWTHVDNKLYPFGLNFVVANVANVVLWSHWTRNPVLEQILPDFRRWSDLQWTMRSFPFPDSASDRSTRQCSGSGWTFSSRTSSTWPSSRKRICRLAETVCSQRK